jgi:2-keto-4-pentenoate hydratase
VDAAAPPGPIDPRVVRAMGGLLDAWRARPPSALRVGWKVGLTDRTLQRRLGLAGPFVGPLTLATALAPGVPHSLAGGTRVGVEPEVAIHLGAPVPAGAPPAVAAAAIVGLAPALEVVDLDRPLDDVERLVACNSFHRAFLVGPTDPARAGGSLAGVLFRTARNGETIGEGAVADAVGDPSALVASVAGLLAAAGEALVAGDWILSGAFTRPIWVAPGDVVSVDLGPLGALTLVTTA